MIYSYRKFREALSEQMRIAIAEEYVKGRNAKEIADEFGVSVSTVRKLAKEIRYFERKQS